MLFVPCRLSIGRFPILSSFSHKELLIATSTLTSLPSSPSSRPFHTATTLHLEQKASPRWKLTSGIFEKFGLKPPAAVTPEGYRSVFKTTTESYINSISWIQIPCHTLAIVCFVSIGWNGVTYSTSYASGPLSDTVCMVAFIYVQLFALGVIANALPVRSNMKLFFETKIKYNCPMIFPQLHIFYSEEEKNFKFIFVHPVIPMKTYTLDIKEGELEPMFDCKPPFEKLNQVVYKSSVSGKLWICQHSCFLAPIYITKLLKSK